MSQPAGYVVWLSDDRDDAFKNRQNQDRFAEPVDEFSHSRNIPLICFIKDLNGDISHIAQGRRGNRAGDDLRRLNLEDIFELSTPVAIETIVEDSPKKVQSRLRKVLESGGLVPPKSFEALIESFIKFSPESSGHLKRYSEARRQRIAKLSDQIKIGLAEQKEAVATALSIADIDRRELQSWDVTEGELPKSFLDGLDQVRLREDTMIVNDLSELPGYEAFKKSQHASVVFQNEKSRLTVVLANRLPLEKLTGTDLIYFNETFQCFLMVQYKAMELDENRDPPEAIFRFPEIQLSDETSRMEHLLLALRKCAANDAADGFRLSENPFFLKFCPRIVFDPDNAGLVKGMYLPLDYWMLISQHPTMDGPRGGKRISYRNVRRYFDNTEFTVLAGGGWVGTNVHQSKVLEEAIKSTLESGRAAVLAVNEMLDRRHIADDTLALE